MLDQTGRASSGDRLAPGAFATIQAHPLSRHPHRLDQIGARCRLQQAAMDRVDEQGQRPFVRSGVPNCTNGGAVSGRVVAVGNGDAGVHGQRVVRRRLRTGRPGKIGVDGDFLCCAAGHPESPGLRPWPGREARDARERRRHAG